MAERREYGARYYSPALGRFISPDPIPVQLEDPQTLNRYAYVRNNPTHFIDPSGYLEDEGGPPEATTPVESGLQVVAGDPVSEDLYAKGRDVIDLIERSGTEGATDSTKCSGICSAGVIGDGQLEAGGLIVGGSAQVAVGGGKFDNGDTAVFSTIGAFVGGPGYGAGYPEAPLNDGQAFNYVTGASAGVGYGVWFSNAVEPSQLEGRAHTTSFQIFLGPAGGVAIQYSSAGSTWVGSVTHTPPTLGWGLSWSSYPTQTAVRRGEE